MAWFITFATYGTHLPGNPQGSFDHIRNHGERRLLGPTPALEKYSRQQMKQAPFVLHTEQTRIIVRGEIVRTCEVRGWSLLALHVRTSHVHGVVEADSGSGPIVQCMESVFHSGAANVRDDRGRS